MGILQVEYPDNVTAALNMDRETFEQDARMAMAVKLYEMGRMTSGQAKTELHSFWNALSME